jgi:hypothetical protein
LLADNVPNDGAEVCCVMILDGQITGNSNKKFMLGICRWLISAHCILLLIPCFDS